MSLGATKAQSWCPLVTHRRNVEMGVLVANAAFAAAVESVADLRLRRTKPSQRPPTRTHRRSRPAPWREVGRLGEAAGRHRNNRLTATYREVIVIATCRQR